MATKVIKFPVAYQQNNNSKITGTVLLITWNHPAHQ
jgi:hypothetical protein